MKKTSILTLLLIACCAVVNAQLFHISVPTLYDGMDSITIHYNPFGTGGGTGDTYLQTYTGPVYAYIYTTDSVSGTGGSNHYADGGWTTIDTMASATFTKVSDTDYVVTMPTMRQYLQYVSGAYNGTGVPAGTYITGLNFIAHDSITVGTANQSNTQTFPVSESYALIGNGMPLSTGPVTNIATHTFVSDANENVVVYYHPQQDTFASDSTLKAMSSDSTLYIWGWVNASNGVQYDITPGAAWGNVPTTPNDVMVKIDSNNFAWDIRDLRTDFMNAGLPSGVSIDTIAIIPRTSGNGSATVYQTANFYVPLVISSTGVASVNANNASASIYPNPATDAIFVGYSFAQSADAKLIINNMMGQTVMTQELGRNQAGNMYLSISNLPVGAYLVTVTNGTSSIVKQLIKN